MAVLALNIHLFRTVVSAAKKVTKKAATTASPRKKHGVPI
jgi:hypothetical protein